MARFGQIHRLRFSEQNTMKHFIRSVTNKYIRIPQSHSSASSFNARDPDITHHKWDVTHVRHLCMGRTATSQHHCRWSTFTNTYIWELSNSVIIEQLSIHGNLKQASWPDALPDSNPLRKKCWQLKTFQVAVKIPPLNLELYVLRTLNSTSLPL